MYAALTRAMPAVHCRVGSSETVPGIVRVTPHVHCRVGSSEKQTFGRLGHEQVHCRVGSSEKGAARWRHGRIVHCRVSSSEIGARSMFIRRLREPWRELAHTAFALDRVVAGNAIAGKRKCSNIRRMTGHQALTPSRMGSPRGRVLLIKRTPPGSAKRSSKTRRSHNSTAGSRATSASQAMVTSGRMASAVLPLSSDISGMP